MGTYLRNTTPPLEEQLYKETYAFEFTQMVRILNHLKKGTVSPGEKSDPQKESVFFKSQVSFAFSPSDLSSLIPRENAPPILNVNFLGIAGVQGPLPTPYTQILLDRLRSRDPVFRDFLDIFNHRIISLLYRIRKKYRVNLSDVKASDSSVGKMLHAFLGLGFKNPLFENQYSLSDSALVGMAGLFWEAYPSKAGLHHVLKNYFKLPVLIKDFRGRWISFKDSQQTRLGAISGHYNTLGQKCVLGKSEWDKIGALTIVLGPLSLPQFTSFFRTQPAFQNLCDLTTLYAGLGITFDLNLILKKEDVPPLALGKESYLGWRSWLKTGPFVKDDGQVYVHPLNSNIF